MLSVRALWVLAVTHPKRRQNPKRTHTQTHTHTHTQAIIGTIGDIDSYQLPDAKGYTSFMRRVLGVSDAERQERREQILGTSLKDFQLRACAVCVCAVCV